VVKGIYLTLLVGPVVPIPVPHVALDALMGVEVTHDTEGLSAFTLTFSLSTKSPLHTIFLIASVPVPVLRVIFVVTVNGQPHVLMDGVVTQTQVTPGQQPGLSTLTVTGRDLTKVMDYFEFSGLPYPAMPVEARVAIILAKYIVFGLIPLIIPSLVMDIPIPIERIPTHQGTDLAYVRSLAASVGYVFYIDPGPVPGTNIAYWGPRIKVGIPQPALNLDMDAHTNVESLSFTFNGEDTILPIVFIQNELTKFPIPVPIPKLNPLQPPLGVIPAPVKNITMLKDTAKLTPMGALMQGLSVASRSADAVRGDGSLNVLRYGRLLKARSLVGVRGAGMAFDGLYYVSKVTTNIKRGEIKQNFTLTRNGLVSITPTVPV
jgi:hypothetical protein